MTSFRIRWVWAAAAVAAGCAGAQTPAGDRYGGNVSAEPTMEVLPEPDVPVESMTERMRFAWMLAQESFELDDPEPPPPDASMEEVKRWADRQLEPWLERKSQLVEAARAELDEAAGQSHRQRILAGAVVGLMYEDVARVLDRVPVPREIREDSEIREAYRDIVDFQASHYLEHARRAYKACSANAVRPSGMRHWSRFCAGRLDGLKDAAELESGETEVTVTVD